MKKWIWGFLLFPALAFGQSTSVTATITDANGQAWISGSVTATFVPGPVNKYQWPGGLIPNQVTGAMDGSGTFTISLPDNSTITPIGSGWKFTLCSNTSAPCVTGPQMAVSGSSMNLSTQLSAIATVPKFPATAWSYGYSDSEVWPIPVQGGMYWNVIALQQRCWTGSAWIVCSSNGGSNITLTTNGTYGASTLSSNTLNIPVYCGSNGVNCPPQILGVNVQTGNYTIQPSDFDKLVLFNNNALATFTVNSSSPAEFYVSALDQDFSGSPSSLGYLTLTASALINGQENFQVPQNATILVVQNGSTWSAIPVMGLAATGQLSLPWGNASQPAITFNGQRTYGFFYNSNFLYLNIGDNGRFETDGGVSSDADVGYCFNTHNTYDSPIAGIANPSANMIYAIGSTGCTVTNGVWSEPDASFAATNLYAWSLGSSTSPLCTTTNGELTNVGCTGGSGVTWPTSADLVISNATNSPAGLAPIDGDCVIGSGGAWIAGSCSGGSSVSSVSGDGTLITNSSSTGSVTLTLGNTGVGYGVWGNIGSSSGAPSYNALSSYPAAAFPTLNQPTTGNAATATNLATYPTLCSSGQFSQGLSSGSNNCATPSGSGFPTGTTGGAAYYTGSSGAISSDVLIDQSSIPLQINAASLPTQMNLTYNSGHTPSGVSGSASIAPDSSGNLDDSENGGSFYRICNANNYTTVCPGSAATFETNGTDNSSQTTLNLINSSTNAAGLTLTQTNTTGGTVQGEIAGTANTGHGGTGEAWGSSSGIPELNAGTFSLYNSSCSGSTNALTWNSSTESFGCNTISSGGTPGGSNTQVQYNDSSSFGGISDVTSNGTSLFTAGGGLFYGGIDVQTGATYTLATTDENSLVVSEPATTATFTVPVATTSGFGAGATFAINNESLSEALQTINFTTSTFNGNSSQSLPFGASIEFQSNGTNYFGSTAPGLSSAGQTLNWVGTSSLPGISFAGVPAAGFYYTTSIINTPDGITAAGTISAAGSGFNATSGHYPYCMNNDTCLVRASANVMLLNSSNSGGGTPGELELSNVNGVYLNKSQLTSTYTNATATPSTIWSFSVVASTNYSIHCNGLYQAASGGAFELTVTGPASPSAVTYSFRPTVGLVSAAPTDLVYAATGTSYPSGLNATAVTTAATDMPFSINFELNNGTTAGTVAIQGNTISTDTLTIEKGATCVVN